MLIQSIDSSKKCKEAWESLKKQIIALPTKEERVEFIENKIKAYKAKIASYDIKIEKANLDEEEEVDDTYDAKANAEAESLLQDLEDQIRKTNKVILNYMVNRLEIFDVKGDLFNNPFTQEEHLRIFTIVYRAIKSLEDGNENPYVRILQRTIMNLIDDHFPDNSNLDEFYIKLDEKEDALCELQEDKDIVKNLKVLLKLFRTIIKDNQDAKAEDKPHIAEDMFEDLINIRNKIDDLLNIYINNDFEL
jgi:hypothetical protein